MSIIGPTSFRIGENLLVDNVRKTTSISDVRFSRRLLKLATCHISVHIICKRIDDKLTVQKHWDDDIL